MLGGGSSAGTRRYLGVLTVVMWIEFLKLFYMYLIEEKNMYEVFIKLNEYKLHVMTL